MKIVAFTDLHGSAAAFAKLKHKINRYKPDIIICCGDFTFFEQGMKQTLQQINKLGKNVYVVPGNHESEKETKQACKTFPNITFVNKEIITIKNINFLFHGGGGFYSNDGKTKTNDEKQFDAFVKRNKSKFSKKIVFVTHAPPWNTKLDYLAWFGKHVGSVSYRQFIDEYKPVLALSGHLHETFKEKQKIGKTLLSNPGPDGMVYGI